MNIQMLAAVTGSIVVTATAAIAQDAKTPKDYSGSYFCKMTASGGIKYDPQKKDWKSATFNVENESYLVKVTNTGEIGEGLLGKYPLYQINVKDFGSEKAGNDCRKMGQSKPDDRRKIPIMYGHATCLFVYEYIFNFEMLKMQIMYSGGYVDGGLNTDSPYVSVGKCERID